MSDSESSQRLSDVQERLLALLPIPASILSILGSSVIIYIALDSRSRKKWSPYTRLLIGLSVSDIVSSINVALASFLRPKDSPRATSYAFGNATTCSISGFMTTVAFSAALYSCMLSYYFLFTARFRVKNSFIARRIEPIMHLVSLGYPIVTATIGAYYDAYADTATYLGCWVNCPPGVDEEDCMSKTLGWIFYGWPFLFVSASLIVNNLMIWCLVHGQSVPLRKKNDITDGVIISSSNRVLSSDESAAVNSVDDDSFLDKSTRIDDTFCGSDTTPSTDFAKKAEKQALESPTDNQLRRLQLVKSQAFLFVGSYALVTIWGGLMAISEQRAETEDEELSILVKMYPIMVLNALLAPMQGFFNMLVYVRPKYMTARHDFRNESRCWAMRRAILGERKVKPSRKLRIPPKQSPQQVEEVANAEPPKDRVKTEEDTQSVSDQPLSLRLKRGAVSTLTASRGGHEEEEDESSYEDLKDDEQEDRWGSKRRDTWAPVKQAPRYYSSLQERGSSLEMISELTETQFEPIIDYSQELDVEGGNYRFRTSHGDSIPAPHPNPILPPSTVDSRWRPDSPKQRERQRVATFDLRVPQRMPSSSEVVLFEEPLAESSIDTPLRAPTRSKSLELDLYSEIEYEGADDAVSGVQQQPPAASSDTMMRPPARRMSPPP
mmetsp:Transcript_18124/g.44839  ORF Transcript_18124/g.44839 Transcript_18124/m.44839 type:complete len:664 (-) Transcript_18124:53-2044(-)